MREFMPVAMPTYWTSPLPFSWVTRATSTPAIERPEVNLGMPQLFGYADSAAKIDHGDLRESRRQFRQQGAGLGPVVHVEDAAAGVGMQTGDPHRGALGQRDQLV